MNKRSSWWQLPLLLMLASGVAPGTPLSTLLMPGGSILVGDKRFDTFSFTTTSGSVDPASIDVTAFSATDPVVGTSIGLLFTPTTPISIGGGGGGDIVFDILFNVSGPIDGVVQQYTAAATGTSFASFEFTTFTQLPTLVLRQCTGDCLTAPLNSSVISPATLLSVDQQIQLNHKQSSGTASVSSWAFLVSPAESPVTVPEPDTWLAGIVLAAITGVVWCRKTN